MTCRHLRKTCLAFRHPPTRPVYHDNHLDLTLYAFDHSTIAAAQGRVGAPVHHQTMNTQAQTVMYARGGRRRKVLDVDLNDTPPNEDHEQVEGSSPPVPIDVEELDDDVIISSPRAFEQARNSSRRIARRTSVIDVESEEVGNHRNQRRRVEPKPQVLSGGLYVILEGSSSSMEERAAAPPPEPTFNCPVCMGPLVEEGTHQDLPSFHLLSLKPQVIHRVLCCGIEGFCGNLSIADKKQTAQRIIKIIFKIYIYFLLLKY
ncbi:unnamed protein product [Lactuca saligna]|uniref:Uncharacterized protein n=1 Tax=Lactuca saligna TaxID=75948 RepID=A0AA36EIZ8_LACSI|nr:unnamed protein product [Lactuca saligna]